MTSSIEPSSSVCASAQVLARCTDTATGVTVTLSGSQPYSKSAGLRPVRSAYSSQLTYTELPVKVFVKYPISRLAPVGSFQASGQAVASIVPESAASASPFTQ